MVKYELKTLVGTLILLSLSIYVRNGLNPNQGFFSSSVYYSSACERVTSHDSIYQIIPSRPILLFDTVPFPSSHTGEETLSVTRVQIRNLASQTCIFGAVFDLRYKYTPYKYK